jgi:hypothetical protein
MQSEYKRQPHSSLGCPSPSVREADVSHGKEEEAAERQDLDAAIATIKRRNEAREKLKRLV